MTMRALALVSFLVLLAPAALAEHLPSPVGFVNDFAGILNDTASIEADLARYESDTGIEIAVVTIGELPADHTTLTYTVEMFEEWGIGKRGEDNGVLVLIVRDGEPGARMRIELGYGAQGHITGAEAGAILDEALPAYEAGDYQSAVETIISGIKSQMGSYDYSVQVDDPYGLIEFLPYMFPFAIFAIFLVIPLVMHFAREREECPHCGSKDVSCDGDRCVCRKCHRKFKRRHYRPPYYVMAGGFGGGFGGRGGGGGGFGGFGGGGSGGGGAGR